MDIFDFNFDPGGEPEFPDLRPPFSDQTPLDQLPDYLRFLNEHQRQAALCVNGPLMVLAGAGSGKTKMLTSRVSYLITDCGVAPRHVLAMTFTNKAAEEMKARIQRILEDSRATSRRHFFGVPEIGTFHSVCVRILRQELQFTPFTKPFVIFDDSDQLSLVKSIIKNLNIDSKTCSPKAVQASINRAKCDGLEPHEVQPSDFNLFERQFKKIYEIYQRELFAHNGLDFGEILCLTYRMFRDYPELRAKYQKRFRFIHVDEYQDTNRAQYLLLSMLAKREFGGHENICVVGDEDQSIYKWRGADINNILDFEKDYPAARVVKLEQNYRSTKTIIRAAGHVIKNNKTRKDKTLWTDRESGTAIVHAQLPDERLEAEFVIAEIKNLAIESSHGFDDFAIFYRTHAQSRQFEDVLRREKISYQIVGGLRFYDRMEIKDIMAYMRVILNPADSISLKRIINTPARGIGKTTIEKVESIWMGSQEMSARQGGQPLTLWDVLQQVAAGKLGDLSGATTKKLSGFVQIIERLIEKHPKVLLSELYHYILDETGYVIGLKKEGTIESQARVENLEEFDTVLLEFEETVLKNIPEQDLPNRKKDLLPVFLEQSSLHSPTDQGFDPSSVKMMSLHSSKGLEFPVVFLVGMEEGLFPSLRPWEEGEAEEIEEERRLCYVGMTRAEQRLYLSNVLMRRIWGQIHYQDPSRFLLEVPGDLVTFKDFARGERRSQKQSIEATTMAKKSDDYIGQKIQHPQYGSGVVIASEGSGDGKKVVIQFSNQTKKKFLLKYLMGE